MRINLRFAEVHGPVFLMGDKGVNLGTKLDPAKRKGLVLVYDRDEKELLIAYEGMEAIVPTTNVASMLPAKAEKVDPKKVKEAQKADTPEHKTHTKAFDPAAAQVATPQSHVHAGPGAGQTGQEPPKGKK